ncbi:MAG: CDP-alcohol phosphatidyltransferase family protein [Anaerolineaceae bacterium]|nr:CDP-alcohol phosphatidyltransferase family protein [Anaerolineaceae bacterium]
MANDQHTKFSLENSLRRLFKGVLNSVGKWLNKMGIMPNMITATGLIGNIAASILIAFGKLTWGGVIALVMGPLDAVDGTMARLRNENSAYGGFVDSVTDRYDEVILLGGLMVYFVREQNWLGCLLVYFAAMGSVLVSYVRSRAETLGFTAKVGIMTRVERYLILIPGLLLKMPYILYALGILAVLGNFTALQRFFHVRKQAKTQITIKKKEE